MSTGPERRPRFSLQRPRGTSRERRVVLVAVLLLVGGCGSRPSTATVDAPSLGISPSRMLGESGAFVIPTAMTLVGEYLVVVDGGTDYAILVMDTASGRIVNRLGPRGAGPNEVGTVMVLFRESDDPPTVWTFDRTGRRFTLWHILARPENAVLEQFRFDGPVAPMSRPVLTRKGSVSVDLRDGFSVIEFDSTGQTVLARTGRPPFSQADYAERPAAYLTANEFFVASDPERERVALLYKYVGRVDVYGVAGGRIAARSASHTFPVPRLRGQADWENIYDVHVNGQGGTDRFIYSMFCGCARAASNREAAHIVRVYDWEGRHVRDVVLDRFVSAIAASPDDAVLYGAVQRPVPMIAEWTMEASVR